MPTFSIEKKNQTSSHSIVPMYETAEAWVKHANCSVCVVDWRELSGSSSNKENDLSDVGELFSNWKYYEIAMEHTVLTKNSIHKFMEFLKQNGMKIEEVSIAGHR